MSRPWLKLWTGTAHHVKWMKLHPVGRGAWTTLLLLAPTEGAFESREQVETLLARDNFDDVTGVVDDLIRLRLLDVAEDGRVVFHDWTDHQPLWRGPSDDPDAKAERNRRDHQRRKRERASDRERDSASGSDRGESEESQRRIGEETPSVPLGAAGGTRKARARTRSLAPVRPSRGDLAAFWDRRWSLSPGQVRVLDSIARDDGGADRLERLVQAAPRDGDLFGWVVAHRNRERDERRADLDAELAEHAERKRGGVLATDLVRGRVAEARNRVPVDEPSELEYRVEVDRDGMVVRNEEWRHGQLVDAEPT